VVLTITAENQITDGQARTLRVLVTSISSLSMLSSAAVVICFLWFREVQKSYRYLPSFLPLSPLLIPFLLTRLTRATSSQIIFMMILSDMASSMSWALTPVNTNHAVCVCQAFFIQMFDVSAFFWTSCVALYPKM
jgi:hypothetical protein